MHVITITNIDHNLPEVEVSVDVYKVYEDSRRQEERQRYERRKHIDGRSYSAPADAVKKIFFLPRSPSSPTVPFVVS